MRATGVRNHVERTGDRRFHPLAAFLVALVGFVHPLARASTAWAQPVTGRSAAASSDVKANAEKASPLRFTVQVNRPRLPGLVRRPAEQGFAGVAREEPGERKLPPADAEIPLGGALSLTAKLHNDSDRPVRVFWGDYAYPAMYRFEITHESGWKPPRTRYWPDDYLPLSADEQFFVTIPANGVVTYELYLTPSPGANCQKCYFSRPGRYEIRPSLAVAARQVLDRETGDLRDVPGAWTGNLAAPPLSIVVKPPADPAEPGLRLRGTVVDGEARPIAGALIVVRVEATSPGSKDGFHWDEIGQDETDADGNFELFGLPANSASFALTIRHIDHLPHQQMVINDPQSRQPGAPLETRVTLTPGREVRGRVIDAVGRPIAEAWFSYRGREIYSDDEGRFILRGLSRTEVEQISIQRRGFVEQTLTVPPADTARFLRVTLGREREQSVSGVAEFLDQRRLADVALVFRLEPVDAPELPEFPRSHMVFARTDSAGRFRLVLPAPTKCRVLQVEARDNGGDAHALEQVWRTSLGEVQPGDANIRLRFDDTHRIVADVRPVQPLREPLTLRVSCQLEPTGKLVHMRTLGPEGGSADFQRLSPGKYRIRTELLPAGRITSSKRVEITDAKPAAGEPDARLRFDFPDVQFGGLKGRAVKADGTPAAGAEVSFTGRIGDERARTADDGSFEFAGLSAGRGWVSAQLKDFDPQSLEVEIIPGETAGPVRLVLSPLSGIVGRVTGRITLDDGRPALGASVSPSSVLGYLMVSLDKRPVDSTGAYALELRNDRPQFTVDLRPAMLWNPAGARLPDFPGGAPDFLAEQLLVQVPLEPGRAITRDIVLDRKQRGQITLRWNGAPAEAQFRVSVVLFRADAEGRDVARLDGSLSFHRFGSMRLDRDGTHVLRDVPFGRRTIVVTSNHGSSESIRIRTLAPEEREPTLTLDPAGDGALRVRVVERGKGPGTVSAYSLTATVDGVVEPVAGWRFEESPDHLTDEKPPPAPHLEAAGTYFFPNLEARSYELRVQSGSHTKTLSVEVKPRETTSIEAIFDD